MSGYYPDGVNQAVFDCYNQALDLDDCCPGCGAGPDECCECQEACDHGISLDDRSLQCEAAEVIDDRR